MSGWTVAFMPLWGSWCLDQLPSEPWDLPLACLVRGPEPHLVWENLKSCSPKSMEGEGPKLPWEEGAQAEGPCPVSVGAGEVGDLGLPWADASTEQCHVGGCCGCLWPGWQASCCWQATTGTTGGHRAAGCSRSMGPARRGDHVLPCPGCSRLHWSTPNKWYFLQRNCQEDS